MVWTRALLYAKILQNQEALEKAWLAISSLGGWHQADATKGKSLTDWIKKATEGYGKPLGTCLTPRQARMARGIIRLKRGDYLGQLLYLAQKKGANVDMQDLSDIPPPPAYYQPPVVYSHSEQEEMF